MLHFVGDWWAKLYVSILDWLYLYWGFIFVCANFFVWNKIRFRAVTLYWSIVDTRNYQLLIIITFSFKPVNHNYESTLFEYISNVLYCFVNHYSLLCIRSIYCIFCFKPHLFSTTNLTTTEAIAVHKISLKMFLIQILFLILFVSISTISKLVKPLLHASITGCIIAIKNASLFMNISNSQLNDFLHYHRDAFNI